MYSIARDKVPLGSKFLPAVHAPSSLSGIPRLSNSRDSGSALTTFDQDNSSDLDSERAQKLKALPACELVKDGGHKTVEILSKSFELMDQAFFFPDLEDLNTLKKKTNTHLIQNQFEHLVTFIVGVKSGFQHFQSMRKPLDDLASGNHTTVDQQMQAVIQLRQELQKNWTAFGINAKVIMSSNTDIYKFQEDEVKNARRKMKSHLETEHDKQESTPSAWDMRLRLSKRYRYKWLQGSKMKQDVYHGEISKTDALSKKLDECRDIRREAYAAWAGLDVLIYSSMLVVFEEFVTNNGVGISLMAITGKLDEAEGKLLTLIELIDRFLEQIKREHGSKTGARQVKRLCARLPHIVITLEMLLSAKDVVVDDHKGIYEEHICELCKAILEHLNVMQEVHSKCRIVADGERQAAFVGTDVPRFQQGVTPHLQGIKDIAEAHISTSKSKEAYEKRAKEDRLQGDSAWARKDRPLVTSEEISWALDKVIDAIVLIEAVSSASIMSDRNEGENGNCTEETDTNDSLPRIKMPDEMINQFYAVLIDEAEKLETLKEKLDRQANATSEDHVLGGPVKRFFRSLTGKQH